MKGHASSTVCNEESNPDHNGREASLFGDDLGRNDWPQQIHPQADRQVVVSPTDLSPLVRMMNPKIVRELVEHLHEIWVRASDADLLRYCELISQVPKEKEEDGGKKNMQPQAGLPSQHGSPPYPRQTAHAARTYYLYDIFFWSPLVEVLPMSGSPPPSQPQAAIYYKGPKKQHV